MVALSAMQSSNSMISSSLPPNLVAVFVGATSGIGLYTLKAFAKYALRPRVYFIGRSQAVGDRVAVECKELNPEGEFLFVRVDVSLIKNVDDVCADIKTKEEKVNLLVMSQGTLVGRTETSEHLHLLTALTYYSRIRFTQHLLPLLQAATRLRRVVSVFAGTKEGRLEPSDFQALHVPLLAARGHIASLLTLGFEAMARQVPNVSFVHDFPGPVKSEIADDMKGVLAAVIRGLFSAFGRWIYIPNEECGERHLFLATSARYASRSTGEKGKGSGDGVQLEDGVGVARGTDGNLGSGVYSVGSDGESATPKVEKLLAALRKDGMVEKVWEHSLGEFKRITGKEGGI